MGQRARNRCSLGCVFLSVISLVTWLAQPAWSLDEAGIFTIYDQGPSTSLPISYTLDLGINETDSVTWRAADTNTHWVKVTNTQWPSGCGRKGFETGYTLDPGEFQTFDFSCCSDEGTWGFMIEEEGTTNYVMTTVFVECPAACAPALTHLGMIVMIGILVAGGAFVIRRARVG